MKSNYPTLRTKRFDVAEKARKVVALEAMVIDFQRMALGLARQISAEEERTGVKNPSDVAYSTFATATTQRRTKLLNSVADLRPKLELAETELRRLELAETRDTGRALPNIGIIAGVHPT